MWSKIDLEIRRALGRNNAAKSLHAYYSTHINPTAHNIETLANLAGLGNSNKWQLKATIIKAHEVMKTVGFLSDYEVYGNSIKADINPTPSQARAIIKQAVKQKTGGPRRSQLTPLADLLPPKSK